MMTIMSWAKEHKQATREKILKAAAGAFRAKGVANVGVADIMERAGLTHGGFYAHFKSKDELVSEAFAQAIAEVTPMVPLDDYLSKKHMLHPEYGCPLPSMGPELTRASAKLRRTYGEAVRSRLNRIAQRLSETADRDMDSAGALACMVGALVLARGLPESEGNALLEHCKAFVKKAVGEDVL